MNKTQELEQLGAEEVRVQRAIAELCQQLAPDPVVNVSITTQVVAAMRTRLAAIERRRDELEHGDVL